MRAASSNNSGGGINEFSVWSIAARFIELEYDCRVLVTGAGILAFDLEFIEMGFLCTAFDCIAPNTPLEPGGGGGGAYMAVFVVEAENVFMPPKPPADSLLNIICC